MCVCVCVHVFMCVDHTCVCSYACAPYVCAFMCVCVCVAYATVVKLEKLLKVVEHEYQEVTTFFRAKYPPSQSQAFFRLFKTFVEDFVRSVPKDAKKRANP